MFMTKVAGIPLDLKAVGDSGTIEGYGSTFGNVDSGNEMVMPGAFIESLTANARKGRKVKMLWQHDPRQPIGVWDDMAEDKKGLYCKGRLLIEQSTVAREAHGLLKEGALDGLSIGYRPDQVKEHPDKPGVLQLIKLDLREVSVVTFQMNDRARVESIKQQLAAGELPTVREFEAFLRDAGGFPKSLAAAIASKATPCLRGEPAAEVSNADFLRRLRDGLIG